MAQAVLVAKIKILKTRKRNNYCSIFIKMKYLFLCSMGVNRSPTAASVAKRIAEYRGLEVVVNYGGIDSLVDEMKTYSEKEKQRIKRHFNEYDKIFVMEEYMRKKLEEIGVKKRKIFCLYILDEYRRNDPQLARILENILQTHIGVEL